MIYDPALYEREREGKKGGSDNKKKFRKLRRWATICHLLKVKGLTSQSNWIFFSSPQRQFGVVVTGPYGPLWTVFFRGKKKINLVSGGRARGACTRVQPSGFYGARFEKKEENGQRRVGRSAGDGQQISFPVTNLQPVIIFHWQNLFTASSLQQKFVGNF